MHDQVSEDGRFEALPLNVTGHEVYAVLYVNYPADDLLEGTFYVEASNLYGKETYEFTFEKYIFDWEEEDPEIDEEETEDPEEEPPTASMGAGTITGWFLWPRICVKYLISFPQKTCHQRKLRQTNVSFIPFLVFGFWSLSVTKFRTCKNIT